MLGKPEIQYLARGLVFAVLCGLLFTPVRGAAQAQPSQHWRELNSQAVAAYRAGRYTEGSALAEQALALAESAFGPRVPDTLTSLSNLAVLYASQGRYAEAEPLYEKALQLRRGCWGNPIPIRSPA